MTILAIDEIWRDETAEDEADGTRSYTRKFQIESDDPAETFSAVRAVLPTGTHPDDDAAYVSKRSWNRSEKSRLWWYATVTYEWKRTDPSEDPIDRAPVIRASSSLFVKQIVRDLNGCACVNSSSDYFDPPLEAEFPRWTYTIQFNAAAVPAGISMYRGAVNNATISILGESYIAGRARIIGLDIGELTEENDVEFYPITVAVECREPEDDGFDLEPLDQGYRITSTTTEAGSLATRTSDTEGNLTLGASHGIVTGQYFNIQWFGGARLGVIAGTVSGTDVPFSGGTGFDLPSATTPVTAEVPHLLDVLIEDEDGNKARPSAPILLNGRGGKLDFAEDGPGVFLKYIVTRKLDLTVFPGIIG